MLKKVMIMGIPVLNGFTAHVLCPGMRSLRRQAAVDRINQHRQNSSSISQHMTRPSRHGMHAGLSDRLEVGIDNDGECWKPQQRLRESSEANQLYPRLRQLNSDRPHLHWESWFAASHNVIVLCSPRFPKDPTREMGELHEARRLCSEAFQNPKLARKIEKIS